MPETTCSFCAEREAHPLAHAPVWNALIETYRAAYGHYPGCPTQVGRASRTVGGRPVFVAASMGEGALCLLDGGAPDE